MNIKNTSGFFYKNRFYLLVALLVAVALAAFWHSSKLNVIDITDQLPRHPTKEWRERELGDIHKLIIHHPASKNGTIEGHARYHINSRGWPRLAYTYYLKDGKVYQTNKLTSLTYHAIGENTHGLAICIDGHYDQEHPNPADLKNLKKLIGYLRRILPNQLAVSGHRDHQSTSCPGDNLYPELAQFR